jgi:hypothetical protein
VYHFIFDSLWQSQIGSAMQSQIIVLEHGCKSVEFDKKPMIILHDQIFKLYFSIGDLVVGVGSSASDIVLDLGLGSGLGLGSPSSSPSLGSLGSGGSVLGSSITSLMRPWIAPTTRHLGTDGTGEGFE